MFLPRLQPLVITGTIALLGTLVTPVSPGQPTSAAQTESDIGFPIVVEEPVEPDDVELLDTMPEAGESLVPPETRAAIVALEMSAASNNVTHIEWLDEQRTLAMHVFGDPTPVSDILSEVAPDQRVELLPAARSRFEVEAAIQSLVDAKGIFGGGLQMYSAVPAADGSSITIGIDESSIDASGIRGRSAQTGQLEIAGIPITLEAIEAPVEARRARTAAPTMSGGVMAGSGATCSTGVPVIRLANSERGMLSADHCGSTLNTNWSWGPAGSPLTVGYTTGQTPGGTDLEVWRDTDSPSTYMLAGSHTNTSSAAIIRGYYTAVVGDKVCHNGAYSSVVCGNTVVHTTVAICYLNSVLCYSGLTGTMQDAGISAAGQGDSGGPVTSFVVDPNGTTVSAIATGIISGIGGLPSPDGCQGVSDGSRLCSEVVLFAPVGALVANSSQYALVASPY